MPCPHGPAGGRIATSRTSPTGPALAPPLHSGIAGAGKQPLECNTRANMVLVSAALCPGRRSPRVTPSLLRPLRCCLRPGTTTVALADGVPVSAPSAKCRILLLPLGCFFLPVLQVNVRQRHRLFRKDRRQRLICIALSWGREDVYSSAVLERSWCSILRRSTPVGTVLAQRHCCHNCRVTASVLG